MKEKNLKFFKGIAQLCDSPEEFFKEARKHTDVPERTSNMLAKQYSNMPLEKVVTMFWFKANIDWRKVKALLDEGMWTFEYTHPEKEKDSQKAEDFLNTQYFSVQFIRDHVDYNDIQSAIERLEAPIFLSDALALAIAPKVGLSRISNLTLDLPDSFTPKIGIGI